MARKSVEQNHTINSGDDISPIENIISEQRLISNENIPNINNNSENISNNSEDISNNSEDISNNSEDINNSNEYNKQLKLIKAASYYGQGMLFRKNEIVSIKDKAVFDKLMSTQLFMEV